MTGWRFTFRHKVKMKTTECLSLTVTNTVPKYPKHHPLVALRFFEIQKMDCDTESRSCLIIIAFHEVSGLAPDLPRSRLVLEAAPMERTVSSKDQVRVLSWISSKWLICFTYKILQVQLANTDCKSAQGKPQCGSVISFIAYPMNRMYCCT